MRVKAQAAGLPLEVDSAGTGDWHTGEPPYPDMQAVALGSGYDMSDLRARKITLQDFDHFDLLLGMDRRNMDDLTALCPAHALSKLQMLTDFSSDKMAHHVPDPYYTRDFDSALALIEDCVTGLLKHLEQRAAGRGALL